MWAGFEWFVWAGFMWAEWARLGLGAMSWLVGFHWAR